MRKREIPVMNVGISLIILIFMNICLAAFAVLSLQNALSDYSLSKKTATHTTQYYTAVNKVQEQLAAKNQELKENQEIQEEAQRQQKTKIQNKKQKQQKETTEQKRRTKQKAEEQIRKKAKESVKTKAQKQIILTENVSKRQQLTVTLQLDETGEYLQYYIKKWQLCSPDDWQADNSLDVYQSGK